MSRPDPLEPLAPKRPVGRSFVGDRKVRLGDVDPAGRLRLDALTRYTQDVSDDDTTDAGLDQAPAWVVRSTVVDELVPAGLGERLRFETFCSGLGSRWAERRLSIAGEAGARYEVATVWVCVDADSGRPHRLTEQFRRLYGEAAGDRRLSARLVNPSLPDRLADPGPDPGCGGGSGVEVRSWQLRAVDFDIYGHVNNAAYWAAVEQWLAPWAGPRRLRLEYGQGVDLTDHIDIAVGPTDGGLGWWWLVGEPGHRSVAASALAVDLEP